MIRAAIPEDLPQLMALAKALRDESVTMSAIAIDETKLTNVYRAALDSTDDRFSMFVYDSGRGIEGGMLGCISDYYFSKERFAIDLFLYVKPALRRGLMGGIIAKRLFERYRDWALAQGVREVRVCVSTGVALESSHRLLTGMQ